MKFYGFQKMTVLDYPEKVACVVFTGGCNFRCPFCHNARLVTDIENKTYDEQEILEYLQSRVGLIDGICVTGGEPLLQVGLDSFLEKVKKIVAEQLGANADEITMDSTFIEDLGADSLDVVELVMALEDEFDMEIDEDEAENISTIGDVVEYIKANCDNI